MQTSENSHLQVTGLAQDEPLALSAAPKQESDLGITIAMYSHASVGLGHADANRALAFALTKHLPRLTGQQVTGLLIVGHPEVTRDRLSQA